MRWPLEETKKTSWKEWVAIAVLILTLSTGSVLYVQLKPLDSGVVQSEAFWCRLGYEMARTMSDTLKLDEGSYVVTGDRWQRIPTCGELRTKNLLHSPSSP